VLVEQDDHALRVIGIPDAVEKLVLVTVHGHLAD
jgi:hypothetical protein